MNYPTVQQSPLLQKHRSKIEPKHETSKHPHF